jgi:hypothetical protein
VVVGPWWAVAGRGLRSAPLLRTGLFMYFAGYGVA